MMEKTEWFVACTGDIYRIMNNGDNGIRVFKVVTLVEVNWVLSDFLVIEVA